jgi:aminopeptidase N
MRGGVRRGLRVPRVALIAALFGCAAEDDPPDPPPTGPLGFSVLDYDYRLDLATLDATTEVTLRVDTPGDCATLPFRASGLADVRLGGEPISSGRLEDQTLVACGRGWEAGAEIALSASMQIAEETWGESQVGFSVTPDLDGQPFSYLVSWIGGCDRFGPCDTAPDVFARYRFEVAHPAGTQVLCPGQITAGATTTVCDFDHDGGPTYSTFGLAASPSWVRTGLGAWRGVAMTLYDAPAGDLAEQIDPELHGAFLGWMVDRFGPYPYGDELRLITGPTYWSGFEHPGNIVLYDRLGSAPSSYTDPLGHVVNHEIAHQWAGDEVTLADTYDFVWKEAMVEYLTFVFEDEMIDEATARATAFAWKGFARYAAFYPVPGERPPLLDYYGDVYGPGPMILFRQIEALFDRAAVLGALADLLGAPRALSVTEVKEALERHTGADLSAYFAAWVYGDGEPAWPTVRVTVTDRPGGGVDVTVEQVTADDRFYGCAFMVRLRGDGPGESQDVRIDFGPDGAAAVVIAADPVIAVNSHVVDPLAETLAREHVGTARADADADANPGLPEPDPRSPWATRPRAEVTPVDRGSRSSPSPRARAARR